MQYIIIPERGGHDVHQNIAKNKTQKREMEILASSIARRSDFGGDATDSSDARDAGVLP